MKKKMFFLFVIISTVLMLLGYFAGNVGSLASVIFSSTGGVLFGVSLLVLAIPDSKRLVSVLLVGILFVLIFGKNLIMAGIDISQGPVEIRMEECKVTGRKRVGSILASYYLEGRDNQGEKRKIIINKKIHEIYRDELDFSIDIILWDHSNVIKEIE